ncbi:MAG: hypothetical protein JWM02_695 [Frankiales bacterium]|nr:hypothetical protein [Frankiales bacterium]
MHRVSGRRTGRAAFLTAVTLAAGCGAAPPSAAPHATTPVLTTSTPTSQAPPSPTVPRRSHEGQGGSGNGASSAAGRLPSDWPPDLPLPPGDVTGYTGSGGRWTVLIRTAGSAADVRQSAVALYTAAGFTAVSNSVLNRGNRQITLVVENRDHSASQTNLVIGVTTR